MDLKRASFGCGLVLAVWVASSASGQALEPAPAAPAGASDTRSPDAVAVVERAREALVESGAFSARVKTYAEGSPALAGSFGRSEALVRAQRDEERPGVWRVRIAGEGSLTASTPVLQFDSMWHGARVSWIDHEARVYQEHAASGRGVASRALRVSDSVRLAPAQVAAAEPFADALRATDLAFEGHEEADGVECSVVSYTDKTGKQRWFFGLHDGLPRRNEMIAGGGGMVVTIVTEFASPSADSEDLAVETWTIPVPEGYERKTLPTPGAGVGRTVRPGGSGAGGPAARMSPDWELASSDGAKVSPGSLRDKVAVLYFWGTWCIPCKRAAPLLIELHNDYAERGVEVVGMACRERDADAAVRYAAEAGYDWTQIIGADEVARLYEVRVYPTFIVLGKGSEIVYESGRPDARGFEGMFEDMRRAIDGALAGEPGRGAGQVGPGTGTPAAAPAATPVRVTLPGARPPPRPADDDDR